MTLSGCVLVSSGCTPLSCVSRGQSPGLREGIRGEGQPSRPASNRVRTTITDALEGSE